MIKILHVEDSDDDADLLTLALDHASPGWDKRVQLSRARNFNEGISMVQNDPPDLIVLDLNLPGRTGTDLLKELKSVLGTKKIPIIILSTSEATEDIVTSYQNCASAYLVKPPTFAGLVNIMSAMEKFWLGVAKLPA